MKRIIMLMLAVCVMVCAAGCAAPPEINAGGEPTANEPVRVVDADQSKDVVSIWLPPDELGQTEDDIIQNMIAVGADSAEPKDGGVLIVFQRNKYEAFLAEFRNEMDRAASDLMAKHPGVKSVVFSDDYTSVKIESDGQEGMDAFALDVYCAYYAAYTNVR